MKLLLIIVVIIFASISGFGQIMQASIGAGSASNRFNIYVRPTSAVNGTISTLQFDVAIDASILPVPVIAIVGVPYLSITWNIDPSYIEGSYRHYQFTTSSSPSVVIGAGAETKIMELEFSGGPLIGNNVSLLTLPGGGVNTGNALFLCSGAASSIEGQLYYSRTGTIVINNPSYTGPQTSSATLGGILLPVKWLSFYVIQHIDDAILNWSVANEEANHHYELQRSSNGTNFITIATVNRSGNGKYNYTDPEIKNLAATILYYRVKQVDIDGKYSYSDVRILKLDAKETQISIYPNPVNKGFYVSIPFMNSDKEMVTLNLISTNGQMICTKKITSFQAADFYYDIKDKALAAGQYYLQIIFGDKIKATKKLYINQ